MVKKKRQPPAQIPPEPTGSRPAPRPNSAETLWEKIRGTTLYRVGHENLLGFVLGVVAILLITPLKDQLPEPFGSKELFSYYFSIKSINATSAKGTESSDLIEDFVSVVINPKKNSVAVATIRLRGIRQFRECVAAIRSAETQLKTVDVKCAIDKDRELLTITNVGVVPQQGRLIINVRGEIGSSLFPGIQLQDGEFVWPSHSRLVEGRLLFLADYWNLVVTTIILVMLGYYYVLKRRVLKATG